MYTIIDTTFLNSIEISILPYFKKILRALKFGVQENCQVKIRHVFLTVEFKYNHIFRT